VAVQPPDQQPQQPTNPTNPTVQRIVRAAAAGQVAKTAVIAPGVAVTLPAQAAVGAVEVPVEAFAHGVKIAIILKILRRLLKRTHTDSADWLTKELRRLFPGANPLVIRQAVERELRFEEAFQQKSLKRVEGDLQKAGALPTPEARQKRVNAILEREKHYAKLREKAMLARAKGHVENAGVKAISPNGAKWVLGTRKNHTLGCLALAGKNWPWEVLDQIPPPIHANCGCSLQPLKPGDPVPPIGQALAMAKAAMALEEAIRAVAAPGEVDLYLAARALSEASGESLEEINWSDFLHPRGRGGKWIDKLGGLPEHKEPPEHKEHEPTLFEPKPPKMPKPDPHMPELSPESTVVSGPKPEGETILGGDVPEPDKQGPIPSFGHIPLKLKLPPAFGADHIKARHGGDTYIVKDHGGDRSQVASELLSNAVYRTLGVDVPTMGHVKTAPEPDFEQRAEDLPNEPPIDAKPSDRISTGVILREPDGRMTLIEPRNHYGGYIHTFPKGGVEPALTPQQNAHKELWEETGLHAHITGVVGDFKGDTGVSRYYVGVRTGGEATPSDETQAIKTVTPDEAAQMLNRPRDQEVLKALLEQPIPTGAYEDAFPPETQGSALTFQGVDGKTKDITDPSEALGKGYMADALLANRSFLGQRGENVRWKDDNTPVRTSMGNTLGYGAKGKHEFGDTPEEVWTMRTRGQAAGTVPQGEDELRQQASDIARILTNAKIDELANSAPFPNAKERKQVAKTLKARVEWMRRFAAGSESLPTPATGADARAQYADAQDGFEIYPEERQAMEDYAGDAGRTLDGRLTSGKNFTDDDRKLAKRLDAVLEASRAPVDSYVYVGAPGAPNKGMVGKAFSMKPYIRAHTEMANARGQMRMRLLVPGDARALHLEDAGKGEPDMLLPRGQRVQVTGMHTGPDGVPQLDGLVLPYRDPPRIPSDWKPSVMGQTTIAGLKPKLPKEGVPFFKKGDRVDVNGNKATVTGDAGKGMANVKLDSGKGYTVPFSILTRLEEVSAMPHYAEALHPRGRGGKWIVKPSAHVPRPSAHAPKLSAPAPITPASAILGSLGDKRGDEAYQALASGAATDTQKIHQVDGKYTDARKLLHQHIVNHFFANARPVTDGKPKAIFTAGGAASGKSGLAGQASNAEANLDIPEGAVYINPDDIKEMLPEYKQLKGMGREDIAAAAVHEESSDLAKLMTGLAMQGNYPVIVDGTGNSKVGKFGKKLSAARDAGYDVEARYAHVPVGEAIAREKKRAERTGRKVAESLLRSQHRTVAQSYVEDISKMPGVHVKVYSTIERGKPKLIAEKPPDQELKVMNKQQYADHVAKAEA
jgi:ADP-ribose pyrophosphatase YjhB (NUDIX family)/predicted ABC-type ATPase